jgi:two-component system OmpR family response regulator
MLVGGVDGPARELLGRLERLDADVAKVADGADALRHVGLLDPDLIILQSPMPGELDCFDVCRMVRTESDAVVVIMAAEPVPHGEIVALAVGADHYVLADTPVDLVVARIRSLVRRVRGVGTRPASRSGQTAAIVGGAGPGDLAERLVDGELEIDVAAREVRVDGAEVELTRTEFDLLANLMRHPRRVLSRDQLMEAVWGTTFDGSHVLDAHLSRLRCKIRRAGGGRVAHAVRGVGFRLRS